ncbi:MAG: trypsin-like peptidase domain-containing protein [Planctomycetes bacterium]|nr:trypsin-like peptidase domain-containing protein [Planctomycetota bacterium]
MSRMIGKPQSAVLARWLVALLCIWTVSARPVRAGLPAKYRIADLKALEKAFVDLAQEVRPSVVAIRTYYVHQNDGRGSRRDGVPISQGSGVIISKDGYIATNRHVLEEPANRFLVILDSGEKFDATVRQTDIRSDLAVIKIEAENLQPVRWGDLRKVRVSHWTFSVGNPFGMGNHNGNLSVGLGTVTALGRSLTRRLAENTDLQYYGNLIETSSPINPGNSGGPLFNVDGELIGIVTAIETSSGFNEGAGFAIPIDKNTRRILDRLKSGKRIDYGYLGVTIRDNDKPTVRRVVDGRIYWGASIESIAIADGPAAKAGLKPRDIVVEVDGVPVRDSDHLMRLISFTPAGENTVLTFMRRGIKRKTTVTLGDRYRLLGMVEGE